jgi:DNA modification methylase
LNTRSKLRALFSLKRKTVPNDRLDRTIEPSHHGDCVDVMSGRPSDSVDFILTDPPYLVRYRERSGRSVLNDDTGAWLAPAYAEMYRVLKYGSFCASFYGYDSADRF